MSSGRGRERGFDFDSPFNREFRKQARERRMAGFYGLVFKASPLRRSRGDPKPLLDYLRGDGPLSDDNRESLAGLIEQYDEQIKHHLKPNGRPRGSISPKTAATKYASCLVRIGKEKWCREHGRKRAPKTLTEVLTKRAIELMEAEFPKARGKISAKAVEEGSYLRPDPKTEDNIHMELEEAKWEIIELALK